MLNFEFKNIRIPITGWGATSTCHVVCDVFLNGKFITDYTYNPWVNAKHIVNSPDFYKTFLCFGKKSNGYTAPKDCLVIREHVNAVKTFLGRNWGKSLKDSDSIEIRKKLMDSFSGFPDFLKPNVDGLIECLVSDCDLGCGTFSDFCSNLGYDEDSRKAFDIYLACQKISDRLTGLGVMEELRKEYNRIVGED